MNTTSGLPHFSYKFNAGPLSLSELQAKPREGNCRCAVQYYFFEEYNLFLEPEKVLNPYCYENVGVFIIPERKFSKDSFQVLQMGDIVYAEKIISNTPERRKAWIISLHSAIYLGNNLIWHATAIENGTCMWTCEKFVKHYRPIAAKRIINY